MNVRFMSYALTLILLLSIHGLAFGGSQGQDQLPSSNRVIVKFKPAKSVLLTSDSSGVRAEGYAAFNEALARVGATRARPLVENLGTKTAPKLRNIYVITLGEESKMATLIDDLSRLPEVEYVEPDIPIQLFDWNDTLFSEQWALENTGQPCLEVIRGDDCNDDILSPVAGTFGADVSFSAVSDDSLDQDSAIVAIIDTGVDWNHPDLAANMWRNSRETPGNGVDDDQNGYIDDIVGWDFNANEIPLEPYQQDNDPSDYQGHGTHCAGIIAAQANNGIGIVGVGNNRVRIMACKIMGPVVPVSVSFAAEAILYCADNGADVISMSWGFFQPSQLLEDVLDYAHDQNVILVAAVGNSGSQEMHFPAAYPSVVGIGATNKDDHVTSFSTFGDLVDFVAPGQSIISLRAEGSDMYGSACEPNVHIIDDYYYEASGTSMSCPLVAGIIGYIRSVTKGISQELVKDILEQSAFPLTDPYGLGATLPVPNIYAGFGRVDMSNALALLPSLNAQITSPAAFTAVSGNLDVVGYANGSSFASYVVDYGEGANPQNWSILISSNTPVPGGLLGSWNTNALTGIYTIRLTVNNSFQDRVTIVLVNGVVTNIASPSEDDTLVGWVDVIGSCISAEFDSSVIDFGPGQNPQSFSWISSNTCQISSSSLAQWQTAALTPETEYTLRLSHFSAGTVLGTAVVHVFVSSPFAGQYGWKESLGDACGWIANHGDFDGDAIQELILGSNDQVSELGLGLKCFRSDGTDVSSIIPDLPSSGRFRLPIPVGRLDSDGIDDFVALSDAGTLLIYRSEFAQIDEVDLSDDAALIPGSDGYNGLSDDRKPKLWLRDVDGDGIDEIHYQNVFQSPFSTVFVCMDVEGNILTDSRPISATQPTAYLSADLDGDHQDEYYYFVGGPVGYLLQYDLQNNLVDVGYCTTADSTVVCYSLEAVDVNYDGLSELVLVGSVAAIGTNYEPYKVWAFQNGMEPVAGFPWDTGISYFLAITVPVFADLDNNGTIEFILGTTEGDVPLIYAWSISGVPFITSSLSIPEGGDPNFTEPGVGLFATIPEAGTIGTMYVADLDGDGALEIIATVTMDLFFGDDCPYDRIYAWSIDGELNPSFPFYLDHTPPTLGLLPTLGIYDLDGDSYLELFATTSIGNLVLTNLDAPIASASLFDSRYYRQNRRLNGVIDGCGCVCPPFVLTADANWTGDVCLRGDLKIPAGRTLNLSPGTTISALPNSQNLGLSESLCEIIVEGKLNAAGTELSPIHFQTVDDQAVATFFGITTQGHGQANLEHCIVSHAYCGFTSRSDQADTIINSKISDCMMYGARIENDAAVVTASTFSGIDPGYGIYVQACDPKLENDSIAACENGLYIANASNPSVHQLQVVGPGQTGVWVGAPPDTQTTLYFDSLSVLGTFSQAHVSIGSSARLSLSNALLESPFQYRSDYLITAGLPAYFKLRHSQLSEFGLAAIGLFICDGRTWDLGKNAADRGLNNFETGASIAHYFNSDAWIEGGDLAARYNYWGAYPPSASKFSTSGTWQVDYANYSRFPYGKVVVDDAEETRQLLPTAFTLDQNYPNPFNPSTVIRYSLAVKGAVQLTIYNILGQKVRLLVDQIQQPGNYQATWDGRDERGRDVASGVYLYQFSIAGQFSQTRKMILMK